MGDVQHDDQGIWRRVQFEEPLEKRRTGGEDEPVGSDLAFARDQGHVEELLVVPQTGQTRDDIFLNPNMK